MNGLLVFLSRQYRGVRKSLCCFLTRARDICLVILSPSSDSSSYCLDLVACWENLPPSARFVHLGYCAASRTWAACSCLDFDTGDHCATAIPAFVQWSELPCLPSPVHKLALVRRHRSSGQQADGESDSLGSTSTQFAYTGLACVRLDAQPDRVQGEGVSFSC